MLQMTIFECQKDKNMTRVQNEVIKVKVVLEFISYDIDNTARNFTSATLHRHFTCKSKNPRILAPLITLEQTLKYKSCRVLKMVPYSCLFCFLTSSGSTQ
jgi:hypothetical protein